MPSLFQRDARAGADARAGCRQPRLARCGGLASTARAARARLCSVCRPESQGPPVRQLGVPTTHPHHSPPTTHYSPPPLTPDPRFSLAGFPIRSPRTSARRRSAPYEPRPTTSSCAQPTPVGLSEVRTSANCTSYMHQTMLYVFLLNRSARRVRRSDHHDCSRPCGAKREESGRWHVDARAARSPQILVPSAQG